MTAKLCVICGEDCAGRPRTKDAKGHYYCQACYDDALAKKRRPEESPHDDDQLTDLLASPTDVGDAAWIDEPASTAPAAPSGAVTPCPNCGQPIPQGGVVCMGCGTSLAGGKAKKHKIKVGVDKSPSGWRNPLIFGLVAALFGGLLIKMALGGFGESGTGLGIALAALSLFAFGIWIVISAFREKGLFWAIGCWFLPPLALVFILISENRYLKTGILALVLFQTAAIAGFYNVGADAFDEISEGLIEGSFLVPQATQLETVFGDDPEMFAAIDDASRMVGTFVTLYGNPPDGQATYWMRVLTDIGVGQLGGAWYEIRDYDGVDFRGSVRFDNNDIERGTVISAKPEELVDWMFVSQGTAIGGRTLIVERSRLSGAALAEFDAQYPYEFRNP